MASGGDGGGDMHCISRFHTLRGMNGNYAFRFTNVQLYSINLPLSAYGRYGKSELVVLTFSNDHMTHFSRMKFKFYALAIL
jgi:hypothetical protein